MKLEAVVSKVNSKSNKQGGIEHTVTFVATNQDVSQLVDLLGMTVELDVGEIVAMGGGE